MATVDERDYNVLQLVARFKQLTAAHIHELLFPSHSSLMPCYRSLRRLMKQNYLARIEHRIVGGVKGGSGAYVYVLGYAGHHLMQGGKYSPRRTVDYHALAIADTYLSLVRLERAGNLSINGYSTEPDCWLTVGGNELKPDLFIEVVRGLNTIPTFIEVDLGSEGDKQIKGKLARYVRAFNSADAEQFPVWPKTRWVAVDTWRAKQLSWLIGQLSEHDRQLFRVGELSNVAGLFL